jgi:hypothetical protein
MIHVPTKYQNHCVTFTNDYSFPVLEISEWKNVLYFRMAGNIFCALLLQLSILHFSGLNIHSLLVQMCYWEANQQCTSYIHTLCFLVI